MNIVLRICRGRKATEEAALSGHALGGFYRALIGKRRQVAALPKGHGSIELLSWRRLIRASRARLDICEKVVLTAYRSFGHAAKQRDLSHV
jgi:hypothetical protein